MSEPAKGDIRAPDREAGFAPSGHCAYGEKRSDAIAPPNTTRRQSAAGALAPRRAPDLWKVCTEDVDDAFIPDYVSNQDSDVVYFEMASVERQAVACAIIDV